MKRKARSQTAPRVGIVLDSMTSGDLNVEKNLKVVYRDVPEMWRIYEQTRRDRTGSFLRGRDISAAEKLMGQRN